MHTDRNTIRAMVRGAYDLQKLRIETGNRLVANFRAKLGLDENPEDTEGKKTIDALLVRYETITAGVVEVTRRRKYEYDGVISSYAELCLVSQYVDLIAREKRSFRDIEAALSGIPVYEQFLKNVPGCGPAMSGVIISELDPHAAKYPSSFWAYAGLDVAPDGRGRSSKSEHLIDVEYVATDGTTKIRKSLTHNRWLKTKLLAVLGPSFLRAGKGEFRDAYYNYKHRLENHPAHTEKTPLHRHNMAIRYSVKLFLQMLHAKWRELEGLPVSAPYSEAKLGLTHGRDAV